MLEKTKYAGDFLPDYGIEGDVLFVGFDEDEKYYHLLDKAVLFAGYEHAYMRESSSLADEYLREYRKDDTRICIVKARYGYDGVHPEDFRNFRIPHSEIKYCTLEGLAYYAKRKNPPQGYMQGFQFIRQVADKYPNIRFAVYGSPHQGTPSQARQMKVDFIPEMSRNASVPFTILEYLRNQNDRLFDKEE